jgi:hypothetical protein
MTDKTERRAKMLASLDDLPAPIDAGGYLTTDEAALNAAVKVGIDAQARIAELEALVLDASETIKQMQAAHKLAISMALSLLDGGA